MEKKLDQIQEMGVAQMLLEGGRSALRRSGALRWGAILFTIAAALMIWPLWQPLLLAAWFGMLARPLVKTATRITGGRRRAAAALTVLLLLLVLVPLGLLLASLVSAAQEFQDLLKSRGGRQFFETIVSRGGVADRRFGAGDIVPLVKEHGEHAFTVLTFVAGATAKGVLGTFVFVLAAYAFLADGPGIYAWVEDQLPIAPKNFGRYVSAFGETGRGLLVGVGLTGLIQGVLAVVAYLALGIPRPIVLGVLTAIASLIPAVGTALVWAPVAVGLAITGHWGRATIMAAIGVFVISLADTFLRPLLARLGSLQLPTFILVVAMFGGLATVGAWGLILGPLLVRLAVEAVAIERDEQRGKAGADEPA